MTILAFVRPFALLSFLIAPAVGSEAVLIKYFEPPGAGSDQFAGEVIWRTEVDNGGGLTLRGVVTIEDRIRASLRFEGETDPVRPFGRTLRISLREWNGGRLEGYSLTGVGMRLGDELGTRIQGAWSRTGSNEFVFTFLPQSNVGYLRYSKWLTLYLTSPEGERSSIAVEVDDTVRAAVVAFGL
jgi:hypothetical protein